MNCFSDEQNTCDNVQATSPTKEGEYVKKQSNTGFMYISVGTRME